MKKNILIILFFAVGIVFPQSKTNLEQINSLLAQVCDDIAKSSDKNISILYFSPPNMGFFENRIQVFLAERQKTIVDTTDKTTDIVTINLENAGVNYKEITKTGFFGDYLLIRESFLSGTYTISRMGKIINSAQFNLTETDSVNYEDLNKIENYSLPFTRGNVPSEPLAPSLLEPVIAIGSAVLTIILFFTVRSN